ncbi:hypothetical protein K1T71_010393 [Dendrolimus kikuchii]|uniref:Uncharacterized protein n=1 Tax=Dendrolimus kikuchii TaxID=765133 RepID=A0ACC1CSI6_9NEOP|nr:hypothetical protein K1T71_010393 [Dendrolimus kikuchii]
MEFFERAHIKRNTDKKETKSDITMKKQLKQMLHGYKENDNKLIKTCIRCKSEACDPNHCFDDSSSVSGFSDLNLTNSSDEVATSRVTLNSQFGTDFSKNTDDNDLSSSLNEDLGDFSDDVESLAVDSQDETDNLLFKESMDTDQRCISGDDSSHSNQVLTSDDSQVSFLSSLTLETQSSIGSESEEFDPDGALASKILKKLNKKDGVLQTQKGRKRKVGRSTKENTFVVESVTDSIQPENKVYKHEVTPYQSDEDTEFHNINFNNNNSHSSEAKNETTDKSHENSSQDSESTHSSPYISITAMNTPSESLSEILGEYIHPTVRNLSYEKQTIVSTNSGMFSTENVQIDEEVSSLIPELDVDQTIEDLELSTDNITTEPNDESIILGDDTIISETAEREFSLNDTDNIELINSIKVYTYNKTCIFVIPHPGRLYVHGKVNLKALSGVVEVFGYTLKDEWCDLYAPNYSYAQCIKTIETDNPYHGLFSKLTAIGLSVSKAEEIVTTIGEYDGVIAMCPLNDRKMDFVNNNFTITDIFGKQSKDVDSSLKQASELLGCSLYLSRPMRVLETHSVWDGVITCGLAPESRGIVCGGKSTGKSTFLRFCVNKLLADGPVLVIDLDPGQAEFTVAGNISATVVDMPLLGINFTHLKRPDRMLNIGLINTMDKPSLYIDAVNSLITYCKNQEEFKNMPWIVNTMGMCNNMGLKFIMYTILKINPTYLLQIDSRKAKKRFESGLDQESIKQLYYTSFNNDYILKTIEMPENFNYEYFVTVHTECLKNVYSIAPRDERYLNFLAYFGEVLNIYSGCGFMDITPYEVNLKDLNIVTNVNVPVDYITKVLNGKIVALCQNAGDRGKIATQDKPLLCLGYGLIRAVNCEKGVLYILTPTPVGMLCRVDTISYADWVPELRGQEKVLSSGLVVPYRTTAQYSQRRLMFTPRRRFNPLQLLKMSRNT